MLRKILILIIVYFSFLPISIFAQLQDSDVTLTLNPSQPKINQTIKASASSFVTNTKEAYYVWKLNNDTRLIGVGKDTFTFVLTEINFKTELSVEITTKEGKTIKKIINLGGADLDLLWEATNSYVPPFYKGKTLFAREGEIKVVAMPSIFTEGRKLNPNNLSYNWVKDDNGQIKNSGFGKSSFSYKNSFLSESNTIEVSVSDINKEFQISDSITIIPREPRISFYRVNNAGIDLNNAITDNHFIPKEGQDIAIVPYFFSPKNLNDNKLGIDWIVNGKRVPNTLNKNILSVIPNEEEGGSATIKVIINNLSTLFQAFERSIRVNF